MEKRPLEKHAQLFMLSPFPHFWNAGVHYRIQLNRTMSAIKCNCQNTNPDFSTHNIINWEPSNKNYPRRREEVFSKNRPM